MKYSKRFFRIVSLFGLPFFYIPVMIYFLETNKSVAFDIILIISLTELVCGAIKYIYPKERPVPMQRKTFVQVYMAGSFPSAHTARIAALAAAIALFYTNKILILIGALLVIGVGYSRIYLKKHYLVDVVAGLLIGVAVAYLALIQKSALFFILKCIYLMLPAYFANMSPVIFRKINFLNYPVDFNRKINGQPIFGKNKTFRGFFFGVIFAIVIAYLQFLLHDVSFFSKLSFTSYESWLLFGFLMGFGALAGDLVKSFFKRRVNIRPGNKFIPFDQIDFPVGSLLFTSILFGLTLKIYIVSVLASVALDVTVNHVSFYMKIRNESW